MPEPQELVQAAPRPFSFLVGEAMGNDGRKLNMIEIHTEVGMFRIFSYPEDAEKIAEHWLNVSRSQQSKIILPSMPQVQSVNGFKVIEGESAN